MNNIKFKNIENDRIKEVFISVVSAYKTLYNSELILERKVLKESTMQAQPIISFKGFFS